MHSVDAPESLIWAVYESCVNHVLQMTSWVGLTPADAKRVASVIMVNDGVNPEALQLKQRTGPYVSACVSVYGFEMTPMHVEHHGELLYKDLCCRLNVADPHGVARVAMREVSNKTIAYTYACTHGVGETNRLLREGYRTIGRNPQPIDVASNIR